jgi:2'-5' RNA ligase
MPCERGQSAVVVPVPAAEPVVSRWRERFDSSAAEEMPGHVTALYPFLAAERLTDEVVAQLCDLCAPQPALEVEFRRTERFPGVLYLAPEPARGFRDSPPPSLGGGRRLLRTAVCSRRSFRI